MIAVAAVGILVAVVVRNILKAVSKPSAEPEESSDPEPKMGGIVTESELRAATGEDGKALFIAVKDPFNDSVTVFDMASGKDFYGPGGPYHMFAGKNATHGLAKSSTDPEKVTGDLSQLTESEKDTHLQWYTKYSSKYPIVGNLVPDGTKVDDDTTSTLTTESKKDA